jgi:Tol biopolymer transport system component
MKRIITLTLAFGITATMLALAQAPRSIDAQFKAAQHAEEVEGDLRKAIDQYRQIARSGDRAIAARALVRMAECHQKLGDVESKKIYERVIREYADQRDAVALARTRLASHAVVRKTGLTTVRVTADAENWDRISPDGRYAAISDDDTGNLVRYELATGTVRALTSDGNPEDPDHRYPLDSVFSRDGRQIAYEWYMELQDRSVLRVVGTDEGAAGIPRTVYDNPDVDITPLDWSADGRWIAVIVTRKDHTRQVGLIGVADGSLRILRTVDWSRAGGLRFSPDSSRLAYHRPPKEGVFERDVFVIAVDGSQETPLTTSLGDDMVLEWTPDGQRLLIVSDRSGSNSVWSIAASGQAMMSAELVKSDIGIIRSLGPTRDGTLFYKLVPATPGIYTASFDIASGRLSPGSVQPLQQFKGYSFLPQFFDDGKSLGYQSRRDSSPVAGSVFTILSMDTGETRDIRPPLSYGNYPHWFPDGRHLIVYGVDLKGRPGIFKVDTRTASIVLTVPRDTCNLPFLSADGQWMFCHSLEHKQLRQLDASSGTVLRTLSLAGQPYAASPNGQYVVTSDLQILTLETGEIRDLIRLAPPSSDVGNNFTISWTPDSRSVVFYGQLNGDEGMWRVPINGDAPQKIDVNVGRILSWRINAKTGQVAFSTNGIGPRLEVWKMDNFLPK